MFDNSLLKSLNSAIDDFNSNKDQIKKNISSSETNNNDVKSILDLATQNNISPSFYLGSILYSSKDDWTIWVNSKKIIAKKKEDLKFIVPQLKLLDINEQYIIFSWQSRMLDNLSPNWKDKLIKDANSYHSKDNRIVITDSNILTFKLYPNQSFSIYDMEILEGFVPDHVEVKKSKMDDKTNE